MVRDFPTTRNFECRNCGAVLDQHQMKCEECDSLVGYVPVSSDSARTPGQQDE